MRFLIDECLTLDLVLDAETEGYEAHHLVHLGKAGWLDWNIAPFAIDGDYLLVTNNAGDFRKLYSKQSIHPGLVIILPNVDRPMQRRLFREVLAELAMVGDLINQVLEVGLEGDEVIFNSYELSAPGKS
jgi:predicted nuclease of predicted toxin-antitoxin system